MKTHCVLKMLFQTHHARLSEMGDLPRNISPEEREKLILLERRGAMLTSCFEKDAFKNSKQQNPIVLAMVYDVSAYQRF